MKLSAVKLGETKMKERKTVRIDFNKSNSIGSSKIYNLNFENSKDVRLVILGYKIKTTRKKVDIQFKFNSRVQVFKSYGEAIRFEVELLNSLRAEDSSLLYEVFYVSKYQVEPPEGFTPGSRYYCPYCTNINYLKQNNVTGYRVCPICGISMNDYYFRKYNNLWLKDQKNTNKGNKVRKRRKKDEQTN